MVFIHLRVRNMCRVLAAAAALNQYQLLVSHTEQRRLLGSPKRAVGPLVGGQALYRA